MTNSREKFEEHAKLRGLLITKWDDGVYIFDVTREAAFAYSAGRLAGRESMRDEAVTKCQILAAKGYYPDEFEFLIKEIQP